MRPRHSSFEPRADVRFGSLADIVRGPTDMSALPPITDISRLGRDVRFVPKADIDSYSTTSSARPISGSGIVIPRALAVLRFTINSTLVTC